jgi:hypothetical protein
MLPEDFRSTHPSSTTLHGSANPSLVIPRACDFFDLFVFFAHDPMFSFPTTESSSRELVTFSIFLCFLQTTQRF